MPSRVWSLSDALAGRCHVDEVGFIAPVAAELCDPAPVSQGDIRGRAVAALLRIAEFGRDREALKACAILLAEFPEPKQQPTVAPAALADLPPAWADLSRRFHPAGPALPEGEGARALLDD